MNVLAKNKNFGQKLKNGIKMLSKKLNLAKNPKYDQKSKF